jgi:MSHA biogenesis protein MshK
MRKVGLLTLIMGLFVISVAHADQLLDPTQPSNYHANGTKGFDDKGISVTSILISPQRRIAVINGNFMKVGDKIVGAEIISIEPDKVNFKDTKGTFSVPIYRSVRSLKENIKKAQVK